MTSDQSVAGVDSSADRPIIGPGKSIKRMTVINAAAAVVALIHSIIVVRCFGTSREIECFFIATSLQVMVAQFMQLGRMSDILVPEYHRIRERIGRSEADQVFAIVMNWTMLLSVLLCLIGILLAQPLVSLRAVGFEPENLLFAKQLFIFAVPSIMLTTAGGLLTAYLNAELRFGQPEAIGLFARIAALIGMLACLKSIGIWALVVALWAGGITSVILLSVALWHSGYRHRLIWRAPFFDVLKFYLILLYTLTYASATQFYAFVFDAALSSMPQGTLAVFKYVQKLAEKANAIFLRPVGIVFFSHFSSAFATGADSIRSLTLRACTLNLAVCVPVLAIVLCGADYILQLLWGPKTLTDSEFQLASVLLAALTSMMLVYGYTLIQRKMVIAYGQLIRLDSYSVVIQILCGLTMWLLLDDIGPIGALAVVVINGVLLALCPALTLVALNKGELLVYPFQDSLKWLIAFLCSIFAGITFRELAFGDQSSFGIYWTIFAFACISGVTLLTLSATASLAGIQEVKNLIALIANPIARRLRTTNVS